MSIFRPHTLDACENIDAALFTGDEFIGTGAEDAAAKRRVHLRSLMERWERQLKALDKDAMDAEREK
jgi:hypothetical protein